MPRQRDHGPRMTYSRHSEVEELALSENGAKYADPMQQQRKDPRPEDPRAMTSRERAEARAAEILGNLEGALEEGQDELALDAITVPDGWTYEWKRQSCYGKVDPGYDSRLARTGWEFVPADRHPNMMPLGHRGEITRDGLVLMQRPEIVTNRVKQIMYDRARKAVSMKEQALNEGPEGTFRRVDQSGRPMVKVASEVGQVSLPIPVPTE